MQQPLSDLITSYGRVLPAADTTVLLDQLIEQTAWQTDYIAFGRRIDIPRLQAWYADENVHYRYASNQLARHHWTALLDSLKHRIETITGHRFNSVLLTFYRNGHDHVGWHADDEAELGSHPVIASLSLGASRIFQFRHKHRDDSGQLTLDDGELIVMQPAFQQQWLHAVQPQADIMQARINLTFRLVVSPDELTT